RKIDIHRFCICRRSRHGKGAGISKTIQDPLRFRSPDKAAILALIDKQPDRIACAEIDPELEMILGRNGLQTVACTAGSKLRRFALFVFPRQEPAEDVVDLKIHRFRPRLQFRDKPIACGISSKRNENIRAEAFGPAMVDRAKPIRASSVGFELAKQLTIDPLAFFHSFVIRLRPGIVSDTRSSWKRSPSEFQPALPILVRASTALASRYEFTIG